MSFFLRAEMLALAGVVFLIVFRAIRKGKLLVKFSLTWLLIAVGMVFAAFCPAVITWACRVVHIEKASNLIYLLGVLTLLSLSFKQTILLSRQSDQIKRLTQSISLERAERDKGEKP